jgi:DNA-binding CsgD family transcriptional regulator
MHDMEVGTDQKEQGVGASDDEGLLERESELEALRAFIQDADDSSPRLALIDGPAGIGKTVLLNQTRRLAQGDGMRVISARGSQLEREFPFGVVRQLFEPLLVTARERKRLLGGAAASAAAVFESLDGAGEKAGSDVSFAALHGLYWLTANLSEDQPLLLAIDDLHWVDHSSLRFVAYLVPRLEGLPVSVVTATRPNEPGADATLLAEIAGDPLATTIHPGALGESGVRDLIARLTGSEPEELFTRACHSATGGNPLFLQELAKAIRVEGTAPVAVNAGIVAELGPRAVSRAVLLRLARVSKPARAVVRAAAILDEGFDVGSLAALAEVDEEVAAGATGELVQAEILRPEQPLGFVHPLIRAVVYHDMPPGERELDHARAARLLADAGAPRERVASHLLAVPPRGDEWVAETLRSAAGEAMRKGAADNAVAYFERALAEPPPRRDRARVTLELGLVESLTNAPAAVEHLRIAYDNLDDPVARGLAANVLARAALWNSPPETAAIARQAAAEMPDELIDMHQALQALEAATVAFGVPSDEALARLEPFREPQPLDSLGKKAMTAAAAWYWANQNGPRDRCVEMALDSLRDGELIDADHGFLPVFAIAVLFYADREEVMDAWEQMLRAAHVSGSMFGITTIYLWRGYTLYLRGDLPEAEQSLRDAVESFPRYGYGQSGMTYTGALLGAILLERGDLDGARRSIFELGDPGPVDAARYWLDARMALALAEGKPEEVLEIADEIPKRLAWIVNPTAAHWRSYKAQALDRLERTDEAIALVSDELELARKWGAPATVGRVLRVLGTLQREDGIETLQEAVACLEHSTARLEYAKALCALGTAMRLARKPTEAREPLSQALELADVCGATALEERARSELHATGARPRSTALSGVESLTPSERRVADLAAGGLSNREIAQELYVTPKTVEVHLSNTYRKLEIRSRRELAGSLTPA